ncbi:amino acid ABC transporter permease [Clostridium guangxiense]|uniref:amino acid ABC transporter permease n=1 Tax=Clostridium guangxiense TaxID=1662055 RepID=UPI001E368D8C|nr:amino acid ABC transporter permease [Clostridium guangxiense]MCD2347933.1 amino acid ABC transporter permease [Clostridium guangxiense]
MGLLKYYNLFIQGTRNTIILSIITVLISIIIGLILALMKLSKSKIIKGISTAYVSIIRGTPLLVQIYIVFYGLPVLGFKLPSIQIAGVDFSRFASGIIAFSVNTSAYICEIIRTGILSIDSGQKEAAESLGFNYKMSMRFIILPQALKNILPALGNEFITIIKESSMISIIGVPDLMYVADTIRGITYDPFSALIVIAIIYFVITCILTTLLRKFEKRLRASDG